MEKIGNIEEKPEFTFVSGGICAPLGFMAGALRAGIKKTSPQDKPDISLISSSSECSAAAVYTSNKVKGAPLTVSKKHLTGTGFSAENEVYPENSHNSETLHQSQAVAKAVSAYSLHSSYGAKSLGEFASEPKVISGNGAGYPASSKIRAVIANSGNANTCNEGGEELAEDICRITARALGIESEQVLIASTGVIGQPMNIEPFANAIPVIARTLERSNSASDLAARAIMTTDTVKKEFAVEFELEGKTCRVGGIAKGSGMINPNMATLLVFITSDADIEQGILQEMLRHITKKTFNRISVDGDTSTNDTVFVLANGLAGNPVIRSFDSPGVRMFYLALFEVMFRLANAVAADGEGATKAVSCRVYGAPDGDTADIIAKSVISSNLLKAAVFAADANWGRILCAIGNAKADFCADNIDVVLTSSNIEKGGIAICKGSKGVAFDEELAHDILLEKDITIAVNINDGDGEGYARGCDLTYEYVKINAEYRT